MRQQTTPPKRIDPDALPDLSRRQFEFAMKLLEGETATSAYVSAYGEKKTRAYVWAAASRLRHSVKVQAWLAAARTADLHRASRTLEERVARMETLAEEARQAGNLAAAVMAEEKAGKLEGHYVDRSELTRKNDGAEELLRQWETARKQRPVVDNACVTH